MTLANSFSKLNEKLNILQSEPTSEAKTDLCLSKMKDYILSLNFGLCLTYLSESLQWFKRNIIQFSGSDWNCIHYKSHISAAHLVLSTRTTEISIFGFKTKGNTEEKKSSCNGEEKSLSMCLDQLIQITFHADNAIRSLLVGSVLL